MKFSQLRHLLGELYEPLDARGGAPIVLIWGTRTTAAGNLGDAAGRD